VKPVRFLVDAQLPPALARLIDGQGHEAEHVTDMVQATSVTGTCGTMPSNTML